MKKLKFLGAAIIAASLIFSGCSSQADDETPESTPSVEKPNPSKPGDNQQNPEDNKDKDDDKKEEEGSKENDEQKTPEDNKESEKPVDNNDPEKPGDNTGSEEIGLPEDDKKPEEGEEPKDEEEQNEYEAPAIADYYKYYLVGSTDKTTTRDIANWGAGSTATKNDDGSWTVVSSDSMWEGIGGVCTPFTQFEEGYLANYEYIVFTVDTTDFVINKAGNDGNYGVNVKVPEIQQKINSNYVADGNVRTYYAPMSLFANAPEKAKEFAIIIGGAGTLKLNEVYLAAEFDPAVKPVTGITITPAAVSLKQNGSQQFIVKDSNHTDCTSEVVYTISGEAAAGSSITDAGLLTVGSTAGTLTVTATYTVDGKDFTTDTTITVLGAMKNLVNNVSLNLYTDTTYDRNAGKQLTELGDVVSITDNVVTLHKPADAGWAEWSCQLFLNITAEDGKDIFEAGKKYYLSVTVDSTADLNNNCVWKEDSKATFSQGDIEYKAGETKVLTAEISPNENMSIFNCLLTFPGAASDITVSNITVYDITE